MHAYGCVPHVSFNINTPMFPLFSVFSSPTLIHSFLRHQIASHMFSTLLLLASIINTVLLSFIAFKIIISTILAMTNDGTSDPLMDFSLGMCAIECEIPKEYSTAEIQAEAHQPQTWSTDCQTSPY